MFYDFDLTNLDSNLRFKMSLEKDKRLYCFIGSNGVGKTSLLETLGQAILWHHSIWQGNYDLNKFEGILRNNEIKENLGNINLRIPNGTITDTNIKDGEFGFARIYQVSTSNKSQIINKINNPFIYTSTNRSISDNSEIKLPEDTIKSFIKTILSIINNINRKNTETEKLSLWIIEKLLLNPNFTSNVEYNQILLFCQILSSFDSTFKLLIFKKEENKLEINIKYQNGIVMFLGRPINRLASGYTALLKIFQEIISGIAAWEALRGSTDILNSDALIFIDEIDTHLHPRWQRNLLPFLKKTFPNATFVVTTHSPLIVRDTEPGEAYELVSAEENVVTARKLGSPRDWYFADLLSEAFHVDLPAPGTEAGTEPALVDLLLEFSRLVREFATTRDAAIRDQALALHAQIGPRLPADDPRTRSVRDLRELLG